MTSQCPACGSTSLTVSERTEKLSVPYGPKIECRLEDARCLACGEQGDFRGVNDEHLDAAIVASEKASIESMLAFLVSAGQSNAYIERVFGLPMRTIARWKNGNASAAPVALLRLLRTFPWLSVVAESGFDAKEADAEVISAALRIMNEMREVSRRRMP